MQLPPLQSSPAIRPEPAHALSLKPCRQRFLAADGRSFSFPTDGTPFWIGSDPDTCKVVWTGPQVQPQHTEARWRDGQLWVRDNQTGCSLVDGRKISHKEWTPMRDGGHLQMGNLEDPALSLGFLGEKDGFESPPSDAPLQITFFGDGSAPDIGRHVRGQPARFERMIQKSGAPVRVNALVATGSSLARAVHIATPWAMGAVAASGLVAAALGGAPMLVLGGLLTAGGALGAFLSWPTSREHLEDSPHSSSPASSSSWSHVRHEVVGRGPSPALFSRAWQGSLSNWPGSRQVVYMSGHGYQESAAGLAFERLARELQGAEAIVLDACNGGQLEALSRLSGSARVAVVSEHTVRGFGFPLEAMFGQSQFPSDPREFGLALVRSAARGRPAASLAGVDLQSLQKTLLPSLDRLGRSLSRLSQSGQKDLLKSCLQEAETTDADPPGSKLDLGSFLARLQHHGIGTRCPELERCTKALNQTVLAMLGHGTLSFDRQAPPPMPEGWRDFLRGHS